MDTDQIIIELKKRYGETEGMRVYMTVMPGIIADFQKMLAGSPAGSRISEEYRLEDGKAAILMSGTRLADGKVRIDARVI